MAQRSAIVADVSPRPRERRHRSAVREDDMATMVMAQVEDEVLGIVISRGSRAEDVPRFSMYVWGPVEDEDAATPSTEQRAA